MENFCCVIVWSSIDKWGGQLKTRKQEIRDFMV